MIRTPVQFGGLGAGTPPNAAGALPFPSAATPAASPAPAAAATPAPFVGPVAPSAVRTTPTNQISPTQSVTRPNVQPTSRPPTVPAHWTAAPYGTLANGDWVWQWSAPATPTTPAASPATALALAHPTAADETTPDTADEPQPAAGGGLMLPLLILAALGAFLYFTKGGK